MILLEKSLLVLEEGILEGRNVFANILKYIRMGASSIFGNMFSVLGASVFLPFVPMAADSDSDEQSALRFLASGDSDRRRRPRTSRQAAALVDEGHHAFYPADRPVQLGFRLRDILRDVARLPVALIPGDSMLLYD